MPRRIAYLCGMTYLDYDQTMTQDFQVKARLYVNFIAVRKYNFLDSFLFCFVYKIFAVTILNVIPSLYFCELRKTKLRLQKIIILSRACKYTVRFLANKIQG